MNDKKTVFIETPEGTSASEMEHIVSGFRKYCENNTSIHRVVLPPGCHAVSADGPRFGIEESLEEYTYKVWGDTKDEVLAMRAEVIKAIRPESPSKTVSELVAEVDAINQRIRNNEPTPTPTVDLAVIADMTERLAKKYANSKIATPTILDMVATSAEIASKVVSDPHNLEQQLRDDMNKGFPSAEELNKWRAKPSVPAAKKEDETYSQLYDRLKKEILDNLKSPGTPPFSDRLVTVGTHFPCQCQKNLVARGKIMCDECHAKITSEYLAHTEAEYAAMKVVSLGAVSDSSPVQYDGHSPLTAMGKWLATKEMMDECLPMNIVDPPETAWQKSEQYSPELLREYGKQTEANYDKMRDEVLNSLCVPDSVMAAQQSAPITAQASVRATASVNLGIGTSCPQSTLTAGIGGLAASLNGPTTISDEADTPETVEPKINFREFL